MNELHVDDVRFSIYHPFRIPEYGEELPNMNPFIKPDGLAEFSNVTVENCITKIGSQTLALEQAVGNVEEYLHALDEKGEKPSVEVLFDNIFDPLEKATQQLSVTWGLAKTLYMGNSILMPKKSYLKMHNRGRTAVYKKYTSLPILTALSEIKQRVAEENDTQLTKEQLRVIDKYILECKLNGVGLSKDWNGHLTYLRHMESRQVTTYNDKLKVALEQFSHTIAEYSEVRSYPPKLLQAMSTDAKNHLTGPWKVTLKPYIYKGFMENCPDRIQRWNVWQAYTRKASMHSIRELQNSTHIEEIRHFRKEIAEVLGYKCYADMFMENNMIGSVAKAHQFVHELLAYARPNQEIEIQKLTEFAVKNGFNGRELEAHDIPYWQRQQVTSAINCDENLIQDYFPLSKVLDGLFDLTEKMLKVKIVERPEDMSTWHEDVKFYDVFDLRQSSLRTNSGSPIAGFYLDLYSRGEQKLHADDERNNGWNIVIRSRCRAVDAIPLTSVIFNFTSPLYGKPCLLSIREVYLLFNRFGSALQHLLTEANYSQVAGNTGVEWDATEVCGNVYGNILFERHILKSISEHVSTKEPLSDQLIDSIHAARLHLAGFKLCKELYLSELDLELYSKKDFWGDIVRRIWPKYHMVKLDKRDSHLCSLPELITGPFAARYFSHIHAHMLAADIHDAFLETAKANDPASELEEVGKRYRQTFLALGGSCPQKEVFRMFRGRDPSPKALVTQLGLTAIKPYIGIEKKETL